MTMMMMSMSSSVTAAASRCRESFSRRSRIRTHHIDLIVMGTHGRRGLAHLVMGSIAERVVREAPCAVMTTHAAHAGTGAVSDGQPVVPVAIPG
jgi:hypothetical protein